MITLILALTLCGDVTVTQSVAIESDASIERLVGEAAVQLLPIAWARFADAQRLPGQFRPNVRGAWYDLQWPGESARSPVFRYGYTATIANRVVVRSTRVALHHVHASATLLSGLPQYCRSATLTLEATERPAGGTRLQLTLTLRLHHPQDWCRWVRRGMCRQGTAEAKAKLSDITSAGRRAILDGRAVIQTVAAEFARRR